MSPLQLLAHPVARAADVRLYVKRDDLHTPLPGTALQGNKVRKLAPVRPELGDYARTVTFGGAYSNHLAALFALRAAAPFPLTCFVRGESVTNPILQAGAAAGAELRFVSRGDYRAKHTPGVLLPLLDRVATDHGLSISDLLILPEGGTFSWDSLDAAGLNRGRNARYRTEQLSASGTPLHEICEQLGGAPDYCCVSMGTGGTAAGLALAARAYPNLRLEIFPALRGRWMRAEIERIAGVGELANLRVLMDYHGGGYAKVPKEWRPYRPAGSLASRTDLPGENGLPPLEPIYTAKLFAGVLDRLRAGHYPPGSTIVLLHTGGIY